MGRVFVGTYTNGLRLTLRGENPVLVSGSVSGAEYGILGAGHLAWQLTNTGTVSGATTFGVLLTHGGTVWNTRGDGGATPLIEGYYDGVVIRRASGTVINAGRVTSHATTPPQVAAAIRLEAGGSVTNGYDAHDTASITGTADGIDITGAAGTVTNLGTIAGAGGYGIDLEQAASSVTNAGSIAGAVGVLFAAGGTLTNVGTIGGSGGSAVVFEGGPARLNLAPGAVFDGRVAAAWRQRNVLDLESARGAGTLAGLGTVITNFNALRLDVGARWTLEGANTLAGGVGITLGADAALTVARLRIAGSATLDGGGTLGLASGGAMEVGGTGGARNGALTVDAGFTLGGRGVLRGTIVANGTIAASGGALTLAGPVVGGGVIAISAAAVLTATGPLSAGVRFLPGAAPATLRLVQAAHMTGTIAGFGAAAQATIDLAGQVATGRSYASTTANYGVLSVAGATGAIAALRFAGSYAPAQFHLGGDGHGGSTITFG